MDYISETDDVLTDAQIHDAIRGYGKYADRVIGPFDNPEEAEVFMKSQGEKESN